jgi:hypothetical protein
MVPALYSIQMCANPNQTGREDWIFCWEIITGF